MIRDVGDAFWILGLVHLAAIPVLLGVEMWLLKTFFRLSTAVAFGIGALVAAPILFCAFVALAPQSDRGMGIIILLLYPALEVVLAVVGALTLLIHGGRKLFARYKGSPEEPVAGEKDETGYR